MRVLHFSDTHLGYSLFDKVNESGVNKREQDFYDSFDHVVEAIKEIKPDFIIHSGDFFHRPSPTNRALTFGLERLKEIGKLNIPFVVIAGNHETPKTVFTSPILKAFKTVPNVYPIFGQIYEFFDFGGIAIHGVPHINNHEENLIELSKIEAIPGKKNLILLHTSLGKNFLMEEYGEQVFPGEFIETLKSFDYVALGHWHNFQKVRILENAWYSGSTERMSDSEIGSEKGYCIVDFNDNSQITPEFVSIPTRKWLKLVIQNCNNKSIEDIQSKLDQFISDNDVKDAIINLSFEAIMIEQNLEFTNTRLKELFTSVFNLTVKRKPFIEDEKDVAIEHGAYDDLRKLFSLYVRGKYSEEEAETIVNKANYYFEKLES